MQEWDGANWQRYLNSHPIVRRLLQRLVWVQLAGGAVVQSLRPLDDGSLSACDDSAVTLGLGARLRLAYDGLLGSAASALRDAQGHVLGAFALRARAKKTALRTRFPGRWRRFLQPRAALSFPGPDGCHRLYRQPPAGTG